MPRPLLAIPAHRLFVPLDSLQHPGVNACRPPNYPQTVLGGGRRLHLGAGHAGRAQAAPIRQGVQGLERFRSGLRFPSPRRYVPQVQGLRRVPEGFEGRQRVGVSELAEQECELGVRRVDADAAAASLANFACCSRKASQRESIASGLSSGWAGGSATRPGWPQPKACPACARSSWLVPSGGITTCMMPSSPGNGCQRLSRMKPSQ